MRFGSPDSIGIVQMDEVVSEATVIIVAPSVVRLTVR